MNPDFRFKQFSVWHSQCAMKVGTDAVLLGAWVNLDNASGILDVGTGSGIIALMCAQRSTGYIDAVEIDDNAYEQASENFRKSLWSDRITAYHNSFAGFAVSRATKYDLVISNPPFFRNALKPPDTIRSTARHDEQLNYESLLFYSRKVCTNAGKLAVIIPAKDTEYFTGIAFLHRFNVLRKTMVNSRQGQSPVRCLLELSGEFTTDLVAGNISIRKDKGNEYTDEYIELTREFYLNM